MQLPIYKTKFVEDIESRDGELFSIYIGLNKDGVKQLREYTMNESDKAVRELTSDVRRFVENSYEEWYSSDRIPFSLIHKATGKLAGLVWIGKKNPPNKNFNNWHTIAYRCYGKFRGTGIMKKFTSICLDRYKENFPNSIIWASIKIENETSAGFASALGFEKTDIEGKNNSLIMVKK